MTRRSRLIAALLAAGALVVACQMLGSETSHAQSARTKRAAETYSKDAGYFYRFRAAFEIKDTGERLDFDYVVACNIRVTRWRDGGLSDDSTFSPRVMVMATAGGQAVMLKTLNKCSGLTSQNGDVHPDILPLAIWFDSVDDLANGLGYVSEDAYDNVLGKLKFHGARIDLATRADWEAWRKKAADVYEQRGALPGPWGYDYPDNLNERNPDNGKYVSGCAGYRRLKLPEIIRDKVHQLWPSARSGYWAAPNELEREVGNVMQDYSVKEPAGVVGWLRRFGSPSSGDGLSTSGLPVRSGRRVQRAPHTPSRWPTETYPLLWPPMTSAVPMTVPMPTGPADTYVHKLEFRGGALNGFAACNSRKDAFLGAISEVDPGARSKRHVFMVDGHQVIETSGGNIFMLAPLFIFEGGEYVFIRFSNLL
jgi:hypothetical protein